MVAGVWRRHVPSISMHRLHPVPHAFHHRERIGDEIQLSFTALVQAGVRLPVSPRVDICDAGHEALSKGVRKTPHHLPHALVMQLEGVGEERVLLELSEVEHVDGFRISALLERRTLLL